MKKHYVQAILKLLEDQQNVEEIERLMKNLRVVLTKRGHLRLFPGILRSVVRELDHSLLFGSTLCVPTAQREKVHEILAVLQRELTDFDPQHVRVVQDESLIGGYTYTKGSRMLDRSFKTRLLDLYRQVTT